MAEHLNKLFLDLENNIYITFGDIFLTHCPKIHKVARFEKETKENRVFPSFG